MDRQSTWRVDNRYRLILSTDGVGEARVIEFEAPGAHSALVMAERHGGWRRAEVYENGTSLCHITSYAPDSFWVITAPVPPSGALLVA